MQDRVELAPLRAKSRRVDVVERVDIMLESEVMRECERERGAARLYTGR